MGLSEGLLDDSVQGDVDAIRLVSGEHGYKIHLDYSGLKVSSADELYHTIWENVVGSHSIDIPPFVAGHADRVVSVEINPELVQCPSKLSSKIWLAKLRCAS